MLNVNALQKTLSAMPLDRLQQYAQMHKNDPYVVAMALSVANTKKEAMAAQQGMAGQQPMPKVVDQDIAGIAPQQPPAPAMGAAQQLPENQGIGQLPAPNMQRMAEGGIVAFDDGGPVPGYADTGLVDQAAVKKAYDEWMASQPSWWQQQTPTSGQREAAAKARYEQLLQQFQTQPNRSQPGGVAALAQTPTATSSDMTAFDKATDAYMAERAAKTSVADNKAGTGAASGLGALAGADVPSTKGFMQQLEGYLGKRAEVPEQASIEKSLEERQKPYLESITKSVEEQRDKLKSGREEAIYMAMIKGGFAAAAGTSPNALANIAKGGEAGIADLSESMKDLRKAAQEQHKMEIELSKAKMDASTGNLKTAWDRQDKAKQLNAERDKLMATAYANITDTTVKANATVKAAGIGATADQRMLEALGGADQDSALVKGFNMKQEMTKRASLTEMWAKQAYPTGNMGQPNEAFLARFPSPEVFIKEAMAAEQPNMGGGGGPNAGMQRSRS